MNFKYSIYQHNYSVNGRLPMLLPHLPLFHVFTSKIPEDNPTVSELKNPCPFDARSKEPETTINNPSTIIPSITSAVAGLWPGDWLLPAVVETLPA